MDPDPSKNPDDPKPPAPADPKPWGDNFEPARAWETIQAQRKAEADAKAAEKAAKEEADTLRKQLEEIETAKLSEADKQAKRLKELEDSELAAKSERERLEAAHKREIVRYETLLTASRPVHDKDGKLVRAAFRDPGDAFQFLNPSEIEVDEQGRPKNVEKLLDDLAKAKPYLLATDSGTGTRPAYGVPATPKPDRKPTTNPAAEYIRTKYHRKKD